MATGTIDRPLTRPSTRFVRSSGHDPRSGRAPRAARHLRVTDDTAPDAPPAVPPGRPVVIGERAEADLAFVRAAVERTALFSAVPGVAGIAMGVSAVAAAVLAHRQPDHASWLRVWLGAALFAGTIGCVGIWHKARRGNVPLGVGPARRFALGLVPPVFAGAVLTVACVRLGAWPLLAPVWLLCYGIGVLGAGAVSVARIVPLFGGLLVASGALASVTPERFHDWWLAFGFGALHVITGAVVTRRYGG